MWKEIKNLILERKNDCINYFAFSDIRNRENEPKMGQKLSFLILQRYFVVIFFWNCSKMNVYIICYVSIQIPCLQKCYTGQSALGQSDCRIFKSTISLEQNDKIVQFFACWLNLIKMKSWLNNVQVCLVKNVWHHFGRGILKLAVCQ